MKVRNRESCIPGVADEISGKQRIKTIIQRKGSLGKPLKYIDLFAGAGGLSEGFIRAGYKPVAHVEADVAACNTLRTRTAHHWLKSNGQYNLYEDYLHGRISRYDLYAAIPPHLIASVINAEIGEKTLPAIFDRIDSLLGRKRPDLIIGGPPCQAYSLVGRSRDVNRMKGDKRNYLYSYYAEFLRKYRPKYFIFENVLGLLSARSELGNPHIDDMIALFHSVGYQTDLKVLNAYDYGVPQKRMRIILVGSRDRKSGFYPEPVKQVIDNITINKIFSDLPSLAPGTGSVAPCKLKKHSGGYLKDAGIQNGTNYATFHISRPHSPADLEIYRIAIERWNAKKERLSYNELPARLKSHANKESFLDRFKVVAGDMPFSHTVVAHIAKDGHYYIHPDIDQNRSLTPREAARLQTFPDDYFFESVSEKPGRTAAYKQIGNAVPILLAQKIAEKLIEVW